MNLPNPREEWNAALAFIVFAALTLNVHAQTNEPSVWTELTPSGTPPSFRTTHGAVYDQTNNRMIIFGGQGAPLSSPPLFNDVWVLLDADGTTEAPAWTQVVPTNSPPGARAWPSLAYDSANNRMILFGGNPNVGYCGVDVSDVWVLCNANGTNSPSYWTQLSPTNSAPSGRAHTSAVYDAASNRLIVYGGQNECSAPLDELWILSNANGLGGS